jgi:6-phosphofructokinase 1
MTKRRIGILTGGGDCPGLNAVIRGVAKSAINRHSMEVIGFHDGFQGLIENRFEILNDQKVSGILTQGGTILGTSNKADPFRYFSKENNGQPMDASDRCMELYHDLNLEALVCLGGDGTMTIGAKLAEKGAHIVGIPKTIDKDVMGTDSTFGFDSARTMATDAIDRLHSTADAHHRIMLVEVMGRNAGWLALESGIAGGGDIILIPEIPFDITEIARAIRQRSRFGKRFSIVVVSEGARPAGGEQTYQALLKDRPDPVRLGGVSHVIAAELEKLTEIECRVAILGHLQRGGAPTALDRLLATRFAVAGVEQVIKGEYNKMVALQCDDIVAVPITEVMGQQRTVPLDSPLLNAAEALGTSFGGNRVQAAR